MFRMPTGRFSRRIRLTIQRPGAPGVPRLLVGAATAVLLTMPAARAAGQGPPRPSTPSVTVDARTDAPPIERSTGRDQADDRSRRRNPLLALAEVAVVNLTYNLANRVLPFEKEDEFHVGPDSWASNFRHGFNWDNDPFRVNQFGHPYQGSNYFAAGRVNGLSYWQSLPLATLGSLTGGWFGERLHPAWNEVVNTTVGGAAFGEVLHRIAWLVRDPASTGSTRWLREAAAVGIDPVGGAHRLVTREAMKGGDKPAEYKPDRVTAEVVVGSAWRGGEGRPMRVQSSGFGSFSLDYGTFERAAAGTPFDAFTMAVRVGGGALLSDASVRGRLAGRAIGGASGSPHQLLLVQDYGYRETPAVLFSGHSVLGGRADRFEMRAGTSLTTMALGGVMLLGAIDSPAPADPERAFDYGSGATASGTATLAAGRRARFRVSVAGWYLHTVTRAPADHWLSLIQTEARIALARGLHLVIDAERLTRASRDGTPGGRHAAYPLVRAGLAWRVGR